MKQLDYILDTVQDPDNDAEILALLEKILKKQAGDGSGLIYGIGHAVYTISDPRARLLRDYSKDLAFEKGFGKDWTMLTKIEALAPIAFEHVKGDRKRVCANFDLYSGLVYRILGIAEELFTPMFAIARCPGWCAHRMEELEFANRIIRPAYKYVGEDHTYIPLEER